MADELFPNAVKSDDSRQQRLGDPGICIALIDSRADLSHPCFAGAELEEVMPIWLQSVMAPSGASHGTHVASIIFGQPGGPVDGIAPGCRGVVIPVYGETESGDLRPCSQEDLARAISLALEAGAHLINISGGELIEPGDVDPLLAKIVQSCERQDVVVIAAAGNDGCECLHAPASLPAVLAVGAADANGQPMPFSNWDGSLASHGVLAPGENIPGAVPGNGIVAKNGTSFACPIVTGMAALLLSEQKQRNEKPSPKAVRDAIVASAIPCTPGERAQCDRMLGGRINLARARDRLFKSPAVTPSGRSHEAVRANAIRSPPSGFARREGLRSDAGGICSFANTKSEGNSMMSEQIQGHPQGVTGMEHGSFHAGAIPAGPSQAAPAAESQSMAAAQSAGVSPQACGCGGGHGQQQAAMLPQPTVAPAQQDVGPSQQPSVPAQHGGVPIQVPYGTQPAATPAQRTAMIAGFPGTAAALQPGRGVAPSQSGGRIPMPTDFINSSNSQLVYVTGELGYDFVTDARRDYFVQRFREMSDDHDYIQSFHEDLSLEPGPLYLPEDNRAMAAFLFQGQLFTQNHPAPTGRFGEGPQDIGSVVWTLIQEGQALYALRPLHTFAVPVLQQLANFLYDQSRPEFVDREGKVPNPKRSERISVAGRILGDITLYNGQQVPVLDVSLRALFNWNLKFLIEGVLGSREHAPDKAAFDDDYDRLKNFLERIYYEVRNLGQAPSDRAVNYLTTNLFQANEAFKNALKEKLELDSIFAEKSPLCRPKSDCWDVVMRFFDPKHRMDTALVEYRLTVDVSDISPVGIGKVRKWARYA
ncbi:S8 family serine peptidase [Bradyrhizobium brasilense]|uniref:S8 family serine peptidase n=1 Tax=Bradyrhizobium brasilense TaxID=1419277 RepID=UPI002877EF5C|nr:S8 family serine peptidase [Bradyrhizobium brasilense]MCP3417932.1 S8 family serine peptidase [Bradyrhizobium brasilense]